MEQEARIRRYPLTMAIIATRKAHQNRRSVDPWTLVHFSTGLALGLTGVPLQWALSGAVVYELAEQVFERLEVGQAFFKASGPEVVSNAVLDAVVFAAGHRVGQWWNQT